MQIKSKDGTIESLEADDASWWIVLQGAHAAAHIGDEDASSIVGPVREDCTPYSARYVGYGAITDVVSTADILGTDEATAQPIISAEAVQRMSEGASGI